MDKSSPHSPNTVTCPVAAESQIGEVLRLLQSADARATQLENRVEREQRGLDARLLHLEGQAPLSSAGGPWYTQVSWDKLLPWAQAFATPLMVAAVAYWLTGRLDLAIRQQEADFSGVKEMREALAHLYAAEPQKEVVDTAALS
jgi:hypothetical protein